LSFRRVRPGLWPPLFLTHLGFLILILALVHGVEAGLDRFLPEPLRQTLLQAEQPLAGASPLLLALLFAAAAVPEEILFRGLILRGLLGRHRPVAAVWISAVLFMVAHGNPLQFPVAIMLGLCAGWYYQQTGSLWPGLVAHTLHNLGAGLVLDPDAFARQTLVTSPLPPVPWIWAAPLMTAAGLAWLRWHFQRPKAPPMGVLGLD
jgi:membrane protease YdiL (CAAX protease family)